MSAIETDRYQPPTPKGKTTWRVDSPSDKMRQYAAKFDDDSTVFTLNSTFYPVGDIDTLIELLQAVKESAQ